MTTLRVFSRSSSFEEAAGESLPTILYRVSEREVVHRAFWAAGAKAVVVATEAARRAAVNFMVYLDVKERGVKEWEQRKMLVK